MSLERTEVYAHELVQYLENRGYAPETAREWVRGFSGSGGIIRLPDLLNAFLSVWEGQIQGSSEEVPHRSVDRALAERVRREVVDQVLSTLGFRDRCIRSKVQAIGDHYIVRIEMVGARPSGVPFPEQHDGVEIRFDWKPLESSPNMSALSLTPKIDTGQ